MFSKSPIKYRLFSTDSSSAALLIHGGCFTEGDETWNNEQAERIAGKCNIDVFTINFSKKSLADSKKEIKAFYALLQQKQQYRNGVGIIGCSSGGFIVLSLLNEITNPLFVTLLCPVMDPEKREDMLLAMSSNQHAKIHQQQLQYFTKRPYPTAPASQQTFVIVAAEKDENVPLSLIEKEIKCFPNASLHIIEGATHAMSHKPNDAATDIIRESVKKATQRCEMV